MKGSKQGLNKTVFLVLAVIAALAIIFVYQKEFSPRARAEKLYHAGNELLKQGKLAEAITEYQNALKIDAKHIEARNNLANLLLNDGKKEEAIAEYKKVLELNPRYAAARNNMGIALASLSRTDEAIQFYEESLKLMPKEAELHNSLGTIYGQMGKFELAIKHFEEAIKLKPDFFRAKQNLEIAIREEQAFKKAEEEKEKAKAAYSEQLDPTKKTETPDNSTGSKPAQ